MLEYLILDLFWLWYFGVLSQSRAGKLFETRSIAIEVSALSYLELAWCKQFDLGKF